MKLSRQYLLGLGSGLILSALIAFLFTPITTESPSIVGTNTTQQSLPAGSSSEETSPSENSSQAEGNPSLQQPIDSTQESSSSFVIPAGASADKIAQLLQNEGWIQNKDDFLTIAKAKKLEKRFKAGTYELTPGFSIENIINQLIQ